MAAKKWNRPQMFQNEPAKNRFQQATKISELMNLGPKSEKNFTDAGIKTAAQFRKLGWQQTMKKLVATNPKHCHSLYAYAIIGSLKNIVWTHIPESNKAAASAFCAMLKMKLKKPSIQKKKRK